MDLQASLNAEQQLAVHLHSGPMRLIAGAGTGKTRTLVYRLASMIEAGIPAQRILLLTFTRKAAQEMLSRARALLDNPDASLSGGTFHSFAQSILRMYAPKLGLSRDFSVLDRSDSEDVMQWARSELGLHKETKRYPKKSVLLAMHSMQVNTGISLSELIEKHYPQFLEQAPKLQRVGDIYQKLKVERNLADYDDLLLYLRKLLIEHEDVRVGLSSGYSHIMVDEYQDTNRLQAQIVCLLASEHYNLCVVGDPAQSIYAFRGSRIENMFEFPRIFEQTRQIELTTNYRALQPLLDLSNAVIEKAQQAAGTTLSAHREGGDKPARGEFANGRELADFVCAKVLELREQGVHLSEMAVLFRSAWLSNELEVRLNAAGIPFLKQGGIRFQQARHVKDVLSYIRVLQNPLDTLALERILLRLPGVGPKTAQRIRDEWILSEDPILNPPLNPAWPEAVRKALRALYECFEIASRHFFEPQTVLQQMVRHYQPWMQQTFPDAARRQKDLESLKIMAARHGSIADFLSEMALDAPSGNEVEEEFQDESPMILSTIHSAKGLEFEHVFLIHLEDGHLPSTLSLRDPQSLEEERRLMYVGLTRAKNMLYLLKSNRSQASRRVGLTSRGTGLMGWSRFLTDEILQAHTRLISLSSEDEIFVPKVGSEAVGSRKGRELLKKLHSFFPESE